VQREEICGELARMTSNHTFVPTPGSDFSVAFYGTGYASKSFTDTNPNKLRNQILWIWVPEEDDQARSRGWEGVTSLPSVITVDTDLLKPITYPAQELTLLRDKNVFSGSFPVSSRSPLPVSGNQLEIIATFDLNQTDINQPLDFGIRIYENSEGSQYSYISLQRKQTASISINRILSGSAGPTSLQGGPITLKKSDTRFEFHVYLDHSIVEIFAQGGREKIISRLYTPPENIGLSLHSNYPVQVQVDVWTMMSCWDN